MTHVSTGGEKSERSRDFQSFGSFHKPEKPSFMEQLMEKSIHMLNREDTRKKLQIYLIDPLLNHVLERIFPYIILICVLFALLLIMALMTFGILILQRSAATLPISPMSS